MGLQVSLCYNGNAREALEFYKNIFNFDSPEVMTFGDMPEDPNYKVDDKIKNLIMYTSFDILGTTVMISDFPPEMEYTKGNNLGIAIVSKSKEDIERFYNAMKEGGEVEMPLEKTFWSDLYGIVTDKFGINWQFNLDS